MSVAKVSGCILKLRASQLGKWYILLFADVYVQIWLHYYIYWDDYHADEKVWVQKQK